MTVGSSVSSFRLTGIGGSQRTISLRYRHVGQSRNGDSEHDAYVVWG